MRDLTDTPEQARTFLDTVMHSDDEDMRRGAFNRIALHIKESSREIEVRDEALALVADWLERWIDAFPRGADGYKGVPAYFIKKAREARKARGEIS